MAQNVVPLHFVQPALLLQLKLLWIVRHPSPEHLLQDRQVRVRVFFPVVHYPKSRVRVVFFLISYGCFIKPFMTFAYCVILNAIYIAGSRNIAHTVLSKLYLSFTTFTASPPRGSFSLIYPCCSPSLNFRLCRPQSDWQSVSCNYPILFPSSLWHRDRIDWASTWNSFWTHFHQTARASLDYTRFAMTHHSGFTRIYIWLIFLSVSEDHLPESSIFLLHEDIYCLVKQNECVWHFFVEVGVA
jgi:hypothetical protein